MEDVVDPGAGVAALIQIPDIASNHSERPFGLSLEPKHLVEVGLEPGREVVQPDDVLAEGEQLLQKIRSDEPGDAGDEPRARTGGQIAAKASIRPGPNRTDHLVPAGMGQPVTTCRAVRGMLPKNALGRELLRKVRIYRGAEHPHTAQQPKPYTVASSRPPRGA